MGKEVYNSSMQYKFNTKKISEILNIEDIGIIYFSLNNDEKWDCYNDDIINRIKNTTASYWENLNDEERRKRLQNHGMTGKKHNPQTIKKMRESALGSKKPSLYKSGKLIKDGKIVEFSCLSHFCKENNLSSGHICELLQGKRKSVKGWRNVV